MGTVSVVMATFNGQQWIGEQFGSLLAQTRRPDELIVCDDASQDGTLGLARQFAAQAPFRVNVIENGGRVGYARNFERALTRCNGDVIFLADQDDIWLPTKIDIVVERLECTGAPLAFHNAIFTDAAGVAHGPNMFERLHDMGKTPDDACKGCCTAVSRNVLDAALPISGTHDWWLHAVARAIAEPIFIDEPLVRYRLHEGHVSKVTLNQLNPSARSRFAWAARLTRRPAIWDLRARADRARRLATIATDAGNHANAEKYCREIAILQWRLRLRAIGIPV